MLGNRRMQIDFVKPAKEETPTPVMTEEDIVKMTAMLDMAADTIGRNITKVFVTYLVADTCRRIIVNRLS